jgi:hypothetical protein
VVVFTGSVDDRDSFVLVDVGERGGGGDNFGALDEILLLVTFLVTGLVLLDLRYDFLTVILLTPFTGSVVLRLASCGDEHASSFTDAGGVASSSRGPLAPVSPSDSISTDPSSAM